MPRSSVNRVYGPRCEHPNARDAGICKGGSVGEFDIPPDYIPANRHALMGGDRDLRRPKSFLCRRHHSMVRAFQLGKPVKGNSHEALCVICNHPKGRRTMMLWENWQITTINACIELDVTHESFYRHVRHFGLDDKKMAKSSRKRALLMAAELGLAAGDHSVATGLKALTMIHRESNEPTQVMVDHNVSGTIGVGVLDLTKLTEAQLADQAEQLAEQLRATAARRASLPLNEEREDNVITLPPSSVREVTKRSVSRDRVQHGRR